MSMEIEIDRNTPPAARRFFMFIAAAGAVIGFDQWTKWLVRRDIPLETSYLPDGLEWLMPYARLLHIQNRGASFGMLQNGNTFFIILTVLIVGGILYYVSQLEHPNYWMWLAAGLYLGGAVGNLIDRILFGAVTDFVSIGTFYIFNVADASINISVALLIWLWIREAREPKHSVSQDGGMDD